MALSVQNKNFLSLLHELDIDLSQFPDKSFDGLFDNVCENMNYFFSWFIENVTKDNVLTQLEESTYFEFEKSEMLPSKEEVEYILSTCNPTYEELQNLDVNYVKTHLPDDLEDLKRNHQSLMDVQQKITVSHNEIKKNQNVAKENIKIWKKQLDAIQENCIKTSCLLNNKVDDIKMFLLKGNNSFDSESYKYLSQEEEIIFQKFNNHNFLESRVFASNNVYLLPELKENFINVETALTLSKGILQSKQAKVEASAKFFESMSSNKNLNNSVNIMLLDKSDGGNISVKLEEVNCLEGELFAKIREKSHVQFQKIMDQYFLEKADLNQNLITKLTDCKYYLESNCSNNLWLLHILLQMIKTLEETKNLRKDCLLKLRQYKATFNKNVRSFELRRQKFRESSSRGNQHPFLLALKDVLNFEEDADNNETNLRNLIKLLINANDDSNFIMHKFRNDLQLSVKSLLNGVLYGPTSQVLYVPAELLINSQKCEQQDKELTQKIKRLVNKYLENKEFVSKSDRKGSLLWIDFLTNPSALVSIVKESSQARTD